MTPSDSEAMLAQLETLFSEVLKLRLVRNAKDLLAAGKDARYWPKPRVTIASHFDVEPAFLVYDPLLGTLGIVEIVVDDATLNDKVREHIDRASYLRHLLLREGGSSGTRALTVELVLVTSDELVLGKAPLSKIGEVVRAVSRGTDCLFHIGVSLLGYVAPSQTDEQQQAAWQVDVERRLRRAFPWLLCATKAWLGPATSPLGPPAPLVRRLSKLTLQNYRVAGKRAISMADARVHLVYGANGSGKSSIAEALELLTTGKIERLELAAQTDYAQVLANSARKETATLTTEWLGADAPGNQSQEHVVTPEGLAQPMAKDVGAGSFRLDQPLMDRLVGSSAQARAHEFARAFFPVAVPSLTSYERASKNHAEALMKLGRWVDLLTLARKTLTDLQAFKGASSAQTNEEFPTLLNRWLEQTAFGDLVERVRSVQQTLTAARANGWQPEPDARSALQALETTLQDDQLLRLESGAKRAVDGLQDRLASFASPGAQPGTAASEVPQDLSAARLDELDTVSRFLFDSTTIASFGLFGRKLRAVLQEGDAPTYGPIVIGTDGWTLSIIKDIDACLASFQALRGEQPLSDAWPGKGPCAEYEAARATHGERLEAGRLLTSQFFKQLQPNGGTARAFDGSLVAALNELLALFTPARWAYDDIEIPSTASDGRVEVALLIDKGRAELHLNTAELNLFTVALFLLCAGRVTKPLNLLVLDDPLQNMDELTSTALARGIAKILRLWEHGGRPEQLLFLFHGQGDLERFSAEIPAAVYRLPWLSPSHLATEDEIRAEGGDFNVMSVQSLGGAFLQDQPQPRPG